MKSKLYCLLLLLPCLALNAQDADVTNVLKLTIINPGVSYEVRIGKYQTAYAQVFINTSSYGTTDSYGETDLEFYFDPAATLQYRYYYNAKAREDKQKRTEMNSMNYLAVVAEMIYSKIPLTSNYNEEKNRRAINRFGICWGLQRNFESRFSVDLNLGLGYQFSKGTTYNFFLEGEKRKISQLAFLGQLNIGFWLNKRD